MKSECGGIVIWEEPGQMEEREDFKAEEHVDDEDIPDRLCEESGHYLNFLFRNSPERRDGRMPITKNIRRKEWGSLALGGSPQPSLERKDRRLSVRKNNIRNGRGPPVGAPQSYPKRVDGRMTGRKNNVRDDRRPPGGTPQPSLDPKDRRMSVMKDNIRKRRSPEGTTEPIPQRMDRRMAIMKCIKRKELEPPIEALQHIKRLKKDVLIEVKCKEHCLSPLLKDKVMRREVSCVRGLVEHLNINLELFSTESLLSVNPSQVLETRKQKVYPEGYEGIDESTWLYVSRKSETTLEEYAMYQSDVLKKAETLTEYDEPRDIIFGTNFDLSDEKIWEVQLKELEKLPEFCRIDSNENLLSFANTQLIGMNTVQTYLKVPGSRTPGHQENNNFCSVNINIGPGITEWFTVPFEFWKKIAKLCAKRDLKFLEDSWWPDLETLKENNIPVTRFEQLPGDLVFLNIGCVHWVQARSVCNNIAWNVGPLTVEQFDAAAERYEYNKIHKYPSVVPMKLLCWNLAKRLRTSDLKLHHSIKIALAKCLVQNFRIALRVEELSGQGIGDDKAIFPMSGINIPLYCFKCNEEVFNILFIRASPHRNPNTHCFGCAISLDPHLKDFKCLQTHENTDLINWFDDFVVDSSQSPRR